MLDNALRGSGAVLLWDGQGTWQLQNGAHSPHGLRYANRPRRLSHR
jgi:hypothetical protein